MELRLMKTESAVNVVDKSVTTVETLQINFKRTDNVKSPNMILTIAENVINQCNYAYIPFFKRYYFLSKKEVMTNETVRIAFKTDPLMTFKDDILASVGNLTRSTMIEHVDATVPMEVKQEIDIYESPVLIENNQTQIMTTLGSGK